MTGSGYGSDGEILLSEEDRSRLEELMRVAIFANEARYDSSGDGTILGDPTE